MIGLAKGTAAGSDPLVRQDLARLYTLGELGRFNALRLKAAKESGKDIPGMPNIAKLSMSQIIRLSRDLGLRIIGAGGMLHAYDDGGRKELVEATGSPRTVMVTELALLSPAPSIYGGTDQIQRNIIGERVLGLPKEAGADREHTLLRASQEQLRRRTRHVRDLRGKGRRGHRCRPRHRPGSRHRVRPAGGQGRRQRPRRRGRRQRVLRGPGRRGGRGDPRLRWPKRWPTARTSATGRAPGD